MITIVSMALLLVVSNNICLPPFGLSFERPYLMEGLNLMIPASSKTVVFVKMAVFGSKTAVLVKTKTAVFE